MSFSPVLPSGGLTGWNFLKRTASAQQAVLAEDPSVKRLANAFRERIGDVKSADDLVNDRELLSVTLKAFGLEEDIDSKFYIKTILEQSTTDPTSLVNKLADKRYLEMAESFGFGNLGGPKTAFTTFPDKIIGEYQTNEFETRVGDLDSNMRLALGLESDLRKIGEGTSANDTKWFSIMGNPPLRQVFETALGLPSAFGTMEIDKQLDVLKEKSDKVFGTSDVSELLETETLEKLTTTFLLRAQLNEASSQTSQTIALTLLQSAPRLF